MFRQEKSVCIEIMRPQSGAAATHVCDGVVEYSNDSSVAENSPECAWLRKYAVTAGDTLRKPSTVKVVPGMTLCGGSLSMLPLLG